MIRPLLAVIALGSVAALAAGGLGCAAPTAADDGATSSDSALSESDQAGIDAQVLQVWTPGRLFPLPVQPWQGGGPNDVAIDASDPVRLMLFPEMDAARDVPEITEACWGILGRSPDGIMCSGSRMVVKRKGASSPAVVACTLLPYDPRFELGTTLAEANRPVALNHPYCASFCVLGGAACSRT